MALFEVAFWLTLTIGRLVIFWLPGLPSKYYGHLEYPMSTCVLSD